MADPGNALVVWGNTGRRLQFSIEDLKMPEDLRANPHFHFYEKQWDSLARFWFTRVLKESALQHMEVSDIVELMRADIAKRWERRRQEQALHKKRKRLLHGEGAAGAPAKAVLITNVVAYDVYTASPEAEKTALGRAVVARVEAVAKETAEGWTVLVDREENSATSSSFSEAPSAQRARTETSDGASESAVPTQLDDHVAIVCVLSSPEAAATVIAHLHGAHFDGRRVVCRFWPVP